MNHITVKDMETPYGYKENYWVIDGRSLPEYLEMWASESNDNDLKSMQPFLGLCPAWSQRLNWKGDIRFVWKLIEMDSAVLPLLLCPDDLDLDCIVIVAEVKKTKDFVYWNRVGYVLHANEDFEEEKRNGILNLSRIRMKTGRSTVITSHWGRSTVMSGENGSVKTGRKSFIECV